MPKTNLKTNKKSLLIIFLFLLILSGAGLAFWENSLDAGNNRDMDSRAFSLQSEARLQRGGSEENKKDIINSDNNKIDNDIMLSVASENAEENTDSGENKIEGEKERELKFRESVKKMVEEIKVVLGFIGDKKINPDLEIAELHNEMKIIKVPEDYKSIQLAIDNAEAGDRVEVSAGEYFENIIMKEGVSVVGLSASINEIDEEETELNSEKSELSSVSSPGKAVLDSGNFGNVVSFKNGITSKTEFAGFIIRNAGKSLSGVFVENSSPFIHDNVITENEYGIYIKGNSSPVIQKNVIQFSNKGIEVFNFEKMEEEQNGSKEYGVNDIEREETKSALKATFRNVAFKADSFSFITNPIIIDNLITDNKIGIDLYRSSAIINHNAISYNNHYKTYLGATYGIYLSKSSAEISNNIITDSGICELCAGINVDKESKNVVLRYNDIWNNKNNFVCFGECVMEDNNMSYEPMFVDYIGGSYKLSEDSPLIGKAEDGRDIGVRW